MSFFHWTNWTRTWNKLLPSCLIAVLCLLVYCSKADLCRRCEFHTIWACTTGQTHAFHCRRNNKCFKGLATYGNAPKLQLFSQCLSNRLCERLGRSGTCTTGRKGVTYRCSLCCESSKGCNPDRYFFQEKMTRVKVEYFFHGKGMYEQHMANLRDAETVKLLKKLRKAIAIQVDWFTDEESLEIHRFEPSAEGNYKFVLTVHADTYTEDMKKDPTKDIKVTLPARLNTKPLNLSVGEGSLPFKGELVPPKNCPETTAKQKDGNTLKWPRVNAMGRDVNVPCNFSSFPFHRQKYATRRCNKNGQWDKKIEVSRCVHALEISKKMIADIERMTKENKVLELAEYINKLVNDGLPVSQPFATQAIQSISTLMEKVPEAPDEDREKIAGLLLGSMNRIARTVVLKPTTFSALTKQIAHFNHRITANAEDLFLTGFDANATVRIGKENDVGLSAGCARIFVPLANLLENHKADYENTIIQVAVTMYRRDWLHYTSKTENLTQGEPKNSTSDNDIILSDSDRKIDSWIVSARLLSDGENLYLGALVPPVVVESRQIHETWIDPVCVVYKDLKWARDDDCSMKMATTWSSVCECIAMGDFGLELEVVAAKTPPRLCLVVIVGCGISITFMVLVVLAYCVNYSNLLTNARSFFLINKCLAVSAFNLLFLVSVLSYKWADSQDASSCQMVASLLHIAFLESIIWMTAEVAYAATYVTTSKVYDSAVHKVAAVVVLVWAIPIVIVCVSLVTVGHQVYGVNEIDFCWIDGGSFVKLCLVPLVAQFLFGLFCVAKYYTKVKFWTEEEKASLKYAYYDLNSASYCFPLFFLTVLLCVLSVFVYVTMAMCCLFALSDAALGVLVFLRATFFSEKYNRHLNHHKSASAEAVSSVNHDHTTSDSGPSQPEDNSPEEEVNKEHDDNDLHASDHTPSSEDSV